MNAQLEMALRLGAHGICVDEGDASRLPVIEWFPDDACKLLHLVADTGKMLDEDLEAVRRVANHVPVGEAYRIESNPSAYTLRTDIRSCSIQEFMARFYDDVEEQIGMGLSERQARRVWIDNVTAETIGYSPQPGTVEMSNAEVRYRKERNAIKQKIGRFERKHGRKKLRTGSPT